ncbi:hypothetical protein D4764_01G0008700 [Takifugu flavidus]|uniref:Uncharacterized protein n=1 Tax=Takifugu flavidus TaxID=433684 RepID=A0A5C6PNP1_9TELE|nr:hypothetical protein D4764_01G0008700 [Takifugu flavidus]
MNADSLLYLPPPSLTSGYQQEELPIDTRTLSGSICAAQRSDEPVHTATGGEEGQRVCCCSRRVLTGMDPGEER